MMIKRINTERNLFSTRATEDKDKIIIKKKRKAKDDKEINWKKLKAENDKLSDVKAIPLMYENVTAGQLILGCIQEVRKYELLVGLPHQLAGTVAITRICKAYTTRLKKMADDDDDAGEEVLALKDLYKPGQYVAISVHSVEEVHYGKKLNLSIMPQDTNAGLLAGHLQDGYMLQCAVASVEDNGYIMDTGVSSIRGAFLPHMAAQEANISGVGSMVWCVVTKIGGDVKAGTVHLTLSADPKEVKKAALDFASTTNMSLLTPGTAVNTTIAMVKKKNLNLILGEMDGVVSWLHLKKPFDLLQQYEEGKRVTARVLYITLDKIVHLTLSKAVLGEKTPNKIDGTIHGLKGGDIIETTKVIDCKPSAIVLKLNAKCRGYCSGKLLQDKENPTEQNIEQDFPIGMVTTCRILKYSYMDQLFVVSMQQSILEQQLLGYNEVKVGQVIKAAIKCYNDKGDVEVAVAELVDGLIPKAMLTDTTLTHPEKKHPPGSTLKCRVLKVIPEHHKLFLTSKKSLVGSKDPIVMDFNPELMGTVTVGCIVKVNDWSLLIKFYNDVRGYVPKNLATKENKPLGSLFCEGQVVKCQILNADPVEQKMLVSLIIKDPDEINVPKKGKKKENKSKGTDNTELKTSGEEVSTEANGDGKEVSNTKDGDKNTAKSKGKKDEGQTKVDEKVEQEAAKERSEVAKAKLLAYNEVKVGEVIKGTIKSYNKKGDVEVTLTELLDGLIPRAMLVDDPLASPRKKLPPGSSLECRVLKVIPEHHRLFLTSRKSMVESKDPIVMDFNPEIKGTVTVGCIFKVNDWSLLIKFYNNVLGYVPKNLATTENDQPLGTLFSEGQVVKCQILNADPVVKKMLVSLIIKDQDEIKTKATQGKKKENQSKDADNTEIDTSAEDATEVNDEGKEVSNTPEKIRKKRKRNENEEQKKKKKKSGSNEDEDENEPDIAKEDSKQCLTISSGFVWDVPDTQKENEESTESDDDEKEEEIKKKKAKKLTKAEREVLAKQEEQRLHDLERARLDKDRLPQTALDYEELLQTSPNSSALWIQFISFHLESAEVDKAKAISRRALQVISMREEEERLNIWTVILRLELLYGTSETLELVYREALTTNDPLRVYLSMAMVYAENDKMQDAEKIYFLISKKFGQMLDIWIKAGIFFYKHNMATQARTYMDRALVALDKRHHVDLINRFAQLEFKFGESERGRTIFESLLSNYPKRLDIWSVYVDLLIKHNDITGARGVLERMTGLKLKMRKMRTIFKKFLDFEKQHGTQQNVETVKRRVEDFVNAAMKSDD